MANYVLWGKNEQGLNAKQEGLVPLETRHKTWDDSNVESLDGLMEQPTFNENSLSPLGTLPLRQKREVFSRKEALAKCPEYLRESFVDLFRRIDELDLTINYYDLAHGKRKNPPRPELLARFSPEEQLVFEQVASEWNQYKYLKKRHELVELRREQYTLRDAYSEVRQVNGTSNAAVLEREPSIDCDVIVRPLGLAQGTVTHLMFRPWDQLVPGKHTEAELQQISDYYWAKKNEQAGPNQLVIDFTNPDHVFGLLDQLEAMSDAADVVPIESTLPQLLATLKFYIEMAELSGVHKDILDLKLQKTRNADIASIINKKWGKSYNVNYISTIFRQRIIPRITAAAAYHVKLIENIYFEDEFKTCLGCGRVLLKDPDNFTRRGRSKDGYSGHCKACERAARK